MQMPLHVHDVAVTCLPFRRHVAMPFHTACAHWYGVLLHVQEGGDEPVWRQVLRHLLDHSDPAVAEHAAAALVE
jgi:hypothetical protein